MAINFLNTLQFNNNESLNFRLQNLGTDPTSDLQEGRLFYHDTDDAVKVYTINAQGVGAWVEVGGGVTSVGATIDGDSISIGNTPITSSGNLGFTFQGASTDYINGEGNLVTFPNIPTVPGNIVNTFTNTNGTYVSAQTENAAATGGVTTGIIDLSAVNGSSAGSSTRFLSKDNEWAVPAYSDPGVTSFKADSASSTYLTMTPTTATTGAVELDADLSAVDGTSDTSTRFLSKDNTWDIPSYTTAGTTYALDKAANSTDLILSAGGNTQDTIAFAGTSGEVEVTGVDADVYKFGLPSDVTITTSLTVSGNAATALQVTGKAQSASTTGTDDDATLTTKDYVDGLVTGGLTFKGTFDAASGEILSGSQSGDHIYNCPGGAGTRVAVAVGDYYVVATTAGSFYCSGDTLDIGDSIIGVTAAAADGSSASDWSIVQSDEGVTDFSSTSGTYIDIADFTNKTGSVDVGTVDLNAVDGSSTTSSKFLTKDNTWAVPSYTTDTGILGKILDLNSSTTGVTDQSGAPSGTTGWVIDVSNTSVFGSGATGSKCTVQVVQKEDTANNFFGSTVLADVTRSGVNITINFSNLPSAPSAGDYKAMLTYIS